MTMINPAFAPNCNETTLSNDDRAEIRALFTRRGRCAPHQHEAARVATRRRELCASILRTVALGVGGRGVAS